MFSKTSGARRLRAALLTVGLVSALATVNTAPASADMTSPNRGFASESVYCDSDAHTIQVSFLAQGEQGGLAGSELFSYFETEPVWVTVYYWANGVWTHTGWVQLAEGSSSYQFDFSGETYWYFQYAFANPAGGYDQGGEWAGDNGQAGWYSDQYGYQSQTSCIS